MWTTRTTGPTRIRTWARRGVAPVGILVATALPVGCKSGPAAREDAPTAKKEEPAYNGPTSDPNSVSPEKLEEIDMFFRRTASHLQFECYNAEVDKTHKKYQGNVSFSLVVMPGGKAKQITLTNSTVKSLDESHERAPGIEECVMRNLGEWEWPEVNAPAPYMASIGFKPAW
jgi:hypothetical protein